jgi:hypothetical protein
MKNVYTVYNSLPLMQPVFVSCVSCTMVLPDIQWWISYCARLDAPNILMRGSNQVDELIVTHSESLLAVVVRVFNILIQNAHVSLLKIMSPLIVE